jgi:MFS family permease
VAVTVPYDRARRLGLAAICLGFLMITTDTTIVNVAVGPIVADLGGSLSAAQWIVSGYTIAFATFLLSAGALADRIGSRVAFVAGLTLFGLATCSRPARSGAGRWPPGAASPRSASPRARCSAAPSSTASAGA